MTDFSAVSAHYTHGGLAAAIEEALGKMGKSTESITIRDLGPVDEFHIGGRKASEDFLDQLSPDRTHHVLDVGCGIGGASRFAADRYGCQVTGIDLTDEFIETGKVLNNWVGLSDLITFEQASATELPLPDGQFDSAFMLHVGMNIPDKAAVFQEAFRVLKPGSSFGVYDVMKTGDEELEYPVPWAATPATSALASPEDYRTGLQSAGFEIVAERNRREFALDFFQDLRAKTQAAGGPPPLGLHILMGSSTPDKVKNMTSNISAGRIAPVEMIARKSG